MVLAATVTGCGQLASREDAAAAVVRTFEQDTVRGDTAAMCAALAPGTRDELEDQEKAGCEQAIAGLNLPAGGQLRRIDVFGQQARAVMEGDTVFLSVFPEGWKITAAACEPRPKMPYRCDVKGD
ncbi:hypothetical protein [Kitasatospora sp. A2-31]|uniref:hypothetical protein n=1 Tax=Kitasatospora sp. A2-31 TaxID=2916414 RepID=UPI001EED0F24|nr:hypothetical protein [Kitasatospora sp. A2-31]MCG6499946.1 hypothetical protein [Kitasatospora sp. A2-31]